jgi:hypothetical protein
VAGAAVQGCEYSDVIEMIRVATARPLLLQFTADVRRLDEGRTGVPHDPALFSDKNPYE